MNKKGKILIIYYHNLGSPMRRTNEDMLYCFERYSGYLCYYVNVAFGIPKYLKDVDFDLIVYHDLLLCKRSLPKRLRDFMKRSGILKSFKGVKAAIIQDEFTQTKLINSFVNEYGIQYIFSAAKRSEWKKIYCDVNWKKVKITRVLTGYIEEDALRLINGILWKGDNRKIDIGYRATPLRYSLGRHGYLKYKIGEVFKKYAPEYGLSVDISTNSRDAFVGISWYEFLLDCKYMLGVESGASVLDPEGKVQRCVEDLVLKNPKATFEEAKQRCFLNLDGGLEIFAVGPRHFEACMTKTCQILVEGEYNGIFKPWEHYIPVKKDFSNVREVLKLIKEDEMRKRIVDKAFRDIVLSRKYTYKKFVGMLLARCLGKSHRPKNIKAGELTAFEKNQGREKLIWEYIPVKSYILGCIINLLPSSVIIRVTRIFD